MRSTGRLEHFLLRRLMSAHGPEISSKVQEELRGGVHVMAVDPVPQIILSQRSKLLEDGHAGGGKQPGGQVAHAATDGVWLPLPQAPPQAGAVCSQALLQLWPDACRCINHFE